MGVNVGIEKRAKKFWQKSAQVAVEIAADGQQDDRHVQINTRRRRTGHRKRRSRNILKIPEARLLVINADPEARKRLKISEQNYRESGILPAITSQKIFAIASWMCSCF